MLFHSIQLFYIISSEDRTEPLPHSPCLWHFFSYFPSQDREEPLWFLAVRCAGSHEGCHDLKGCPHLLLSDKDPGYLCQGLSEASRKEAESEAANQPKPNPPSPTPNQPKVCPGPYATAVAGGVEELGGITPSLNVKSRSSYTHKQEPGTETDRMKFHRN